MMIKVRNIRIFFNWLQRVCIFCCNYKYLFHFKLDGEMRDLKRRKKRRERKINNRYDIDIRKCKKNKMKMEWKWIVREWDVSL